MTTTLARSLRVESLPTRPAGSCRYGAQISVLEGVTYAEFDPLLSEVALSTVKKLGNHNTTWFAEGRSTYWFATPALRDDFVADWAA